VHSIVVTSVKATEFSAHQLTRDMSDTLVVAVSQSGTTTDTNRTVDLAREHGAWIIGVVNRRNSDLVYKSHGVLYTSDGRDIEMSVASTKAFYAQNVAGQILALALGQSIGSVPEERLRHEIDALSKLPQAMEETLALSSQIAEIARRFAGRRPYWAVVGSGTGKIAADEIRIKLSELCYKSIASDYIEDKKHIDLSSEPMVLVCASNIPSGMVSDVVKEVAIFKAHQSIPIVIADAGEDRFTPYAAGVVQTPVFESSLSYLLPTMVGHLFGYHAASAFDELAGRLRQIRTSLVQELQTGGPEGPGHPLTDMAEIPDSVLEGIREFHDLLLDGAMDSCLSPAVAAKVSALFRVILGRAPVESYNAQFGTVTTPSGFFETLLLTLSEAINELARPIDAIKHQAKTVTVGISRGDDRAAVEGPLFSALGQMGLDVNGMPEHHRAFLTAFELIVSQVVGATVYRLDNLDTVGRPRTETTIRAEGKMGCAAKINSRCENRAPLSGTKWGVAKSREIFLGYGQTDGRKLLILPLIGEQTEGHLVLFHLELQRRRDSDARMRALSVHSSLLERLRIAVTELKMEWDPMLLDRVENDTLFFDDPEKVAEEVSSQRIDG
jgi:glucosamine--fructose-6-phosphate aminotransferase (isomerizing)